jgi:membrane associated rhomboid family serine protease
LLRHEGWIAEAAVDFRKLGNLLVLAGVAVLVAACIWWFSFYSSVVREIGQATGREGSVFDVVACLYSTSGICGLVASVAVLAGKTAYEPLLFWFGLAGLILGVLIRYTAKPSGAT